MTIDTKIPVVVNIVDGGIGINFGKRHGLEGDAHRAFLHDLLINAGFTFPETVRYSRNKVAQDGKAYVDWMRLRISSDECQVNGVNPADAVLHLKSYLGSALIFENHGVSFDIG